MYNLDEYELQQIANPEWDKAGRVHDWRNHVPDEIEKTWDNLSFETREIVYVMAEKQADREVWD